MFASLKQGPRWPFHRRQGRRSPIAFRPFLEALEDRNLPSSTVSPGPQPPSGLSFSSANATQTGGPQPATPQDTSIGSSAPTNSTSPGSQQGQSQANTVGSPQQVLLTSSQQTGFGANPFSPTRESGMNLTNPSFNGPAPGFLTGPMTFLFTNQASSSTPGLPVQGPSSYSPGVAFGFQGYPALQNPAVNFRTALGYGPYNQSTPPGCSRSAERRGLPIWRPTAPNSCPRRPLLRRLRRRRRAFRRPPPSSPRRRLC